MKLTFGILFALLAMSCQAETSTSKKSLPVNAAEQAVIKNEASKVKLPDEKEEDCDDKAKKTVEIKPESISLTGNTGCSLDEVK